MIMHVCVREHISTMINCWNEGVCVLCERRASQARMGLFISLISSWTLNFDALRYDDGLI